MREYEDYKDELESWIGRMVGPDAAEDIVQEAFVKFLGAEGIEYPYTWLVRTAEGLAKHLIRDRGRHEAVVDPVAFADITSREVTSDCDTEAVALAMRQLPKGDQELLHLSNWKGLKSTAIGKRLGLSAGSVRVRTHRAKTRLKNILEKSTILATLSGM